MGLAVGRLERIVRVVGKHVLLDVAIDHLVQPGLGGGRRRRGGEMHTRAGGGRPARQDPDHRCCRWRHGCRVGMGRRRVKVGRTEIYHGGGSGDGKRPPYGQHDLLHCPHHNVCRRRTAARTGCALTEKTSIRLLSFIVLQSTIAVPPRPGQGVETGGRGAGGG